MKNKLYKILLILGIVATLISVPAFWFLYNTPNNLEVDFLDVGQGDAILIKSPYGQNILIDGGPDDRIIGELSSNLAFWDKKIDLVILTHPHDDHVAGLIDVIKRYKVEKILYTGVVHNSPNYLAFLELVKARKIPIIIIDKPKEIKLGEDCEMQIIYPQESFLGKHVSNLNNSSIVMKLVYGENKFLFTGDAESEVEQELLEKNIDLHADVLKAGHHGSDTSSSEEFLKAVSPEFVVMQVGDDNDFGHPSRRIIKRLERMDSKILRNDLDGAIKFISDGKEIMSFP